MLTINKNIKEDAAIYTLSGRLDTVTAPELEEDLLAVIPTIRSLELDFSGVDYISSAGLRVLLTSQKRINAQDGSMKLTHVDSMIMGIFEMTGFSEILTIE